jgi:hypothetical protein
MELTKNADSFTEQQEIFTGEMISRIADHLEASGIEGEKLKELTGQIAFTVASMLDGVSDISFDGSVAKPLLTFFTNDEEVIDFGGNSYTHELVYGILNAMFDSNT